MNKHLVEAIKEYQTWGTLFEEMDLECLASREGYTLDSGEFWFTLARDNECQAYKFAPYALQLRENEIKWGYR